MNGVDYILVDGYNVINSWKNLKELKDESLEDARDKLVDMLQETAALKAIGIAVVFDAHFVKGSIEKHEKVGKIEVVYTKEGESADCYIERKVVELSKKVVVGVVTSDYLEQRITLQMGGIRITPKELFDDIRNLKRRVNEKTKLSYIDERNTLENYVNKDILEKLEKMRRNL